MVNNHYIGNDCLFCKRIFIFGDRNTTNQFWRNRGYCDFICYWTNKAGNSVYLNLRQQKIVQMVLKLPVDNLPL